MITRKQSNGHAGEEMALYWFNAHGWQMQKLEPPVRVRGRTGRPGIFLAAFVASGQPDYVGYVMCETETADLPVFRACEVKEAHGATMPASRLTPTQRAVMASYPEGTAFVGILWDEYFEMHSFIAAGSYKQGEGIR